MTITLNFREIFIEIKRKAGYNVKVATPRKAKKGGVSLEIIISFLISVLASIAAYYICKWLDRNDNGNEPRE